MEEEKEEWRDVVGYEGLYEVSNFGRMKSLSRKGRLGDSFIGGSKDGAGYLQIALYKNRVRTFKNIHQIVAIAFLGHIPSGHSIVVNHINGDKIDNSVKNIELITGRENVSSTYFRRDLDRLSSKFAGVFYDKKLCKWRASIMIGKKSLNLGLFKLEKDAADAYKIKLNEVKMK